MDIKKKLLAVAGLSVGLGGLALLTYLRENKKMDESRIRSEFENFMNSIDEYFKVNNEKEKVIF